MNKKEKQIILFHVNMEATCMHLAYPERETDPVHYAFTLGELSAVEHLASRLGVSKEEIEKAVEKGRR